jgi:hypothetical protein
MARGDPDGCRRVSGAVIPVQRSLEPLRSCRVPTAFGAGRDRSASMRYRAGIHRDRTNLKTIKTTCLARCLARD